MLLLLRVLVLSLCLAIATQGQVEAQKAPDQDAILAVVKRMFDGMRAGDSAMVHSTFHPRAFLASAMSRQAGPTVEVDSLAAFLQAVGSPHDSVWDERTRNPVVHQDGTLATAWMEYSFYVGTRFNHCGVDTFQLAKEGNEWKIIALSDTRRRRPCPEQP